VAVLLAALAGVTAGLFVYLRKDPEPIFRAIAVTHYAHPDWPPNPWAGDDARGLRDRFGGDSAQASQDQERARILRQLTEAAEQSRSDRRRPLVVYLSALGTVTADGTVYLIPGDGKPDDPSTWLPLKDVLEPLRRTEAKRLLILDVRPAAGPRSLQPAADVNEALDAALEKLDQEGNLPFFVLTANTPAGGPLVLRSVRRTAFGLALAHGAGGAADGWGPDRGKDGKVAVTELAAYVRSATHQATVAAGALPQVPRLHGMVTDFTLLPVPPSGPESLPLAADAEPYPSWLAAAWKEREAWIAGGLHRRAPRVVRQMGLEAVRAERRWLDGYDPKQVEERFAPIATELRAVAKELPPIVRPARSVARTRDRNPDAVKAAGQALRPLFDKVRDPAGVKPDEFVAAQQAVWAKPPDAAPFDATAAALLAFALSLEDPSYEQIRRLSETADGFRTKVAPGLTHPEVLTLDLIAGLDTKLVARWQPGTIRQLLLAAQAAEEAAAGDGRCLPWVRDELAAADATRRKAVVVLCGYSSKEEYAQAAADLGVARGRYAAVQAAVVALAKAWEEEEETRAVLADLAAEFPDVPVSAPEAVASGWADLADGFRRLQALVRPPPQPRLPGLDDLGRVVQGVRAGRHRLIGLVKLPDRPSVRGLEHALGWPWWSVRERDDLITRLAQADREVAGSVLQKWPHKPGGADPPVPAKASAAVARDSVRDFRRIARLVSVADDGPESKADLAAVGALPQPPGPSDLAEAARRVRTGWRVRLPELYRSADAARRADLGWAVEPDDIPAAPRPGLSVPPNPERAYRLAREKEFHTWLADTRYRADAAAVRALNLTSKGARTYADGLTATATEYLDWTRTP
jgi:hypothetical protein